MNGQFKFKVVNSDAANDFVLVLLPGAFNIQGYSGAAYADLVLHNHNPAAMKSAGYGIDFILDDGQVDDTNSKMLCTAGNSKFSIDHFRRSLVGNPLSCDELVIQADNVDVFDQQITYKRDSAIKGLGEEYIDLSRFFDTSQNQDNKIVVKYPFYLTGQTIMFMNIPKGRTVTFTFNNLVPLRSK